MTTTLWQILKLQTRIKEAPLTKLTDWCLQHGFSVKVIHDRSPFYRGLPEWGEHMELTIRGAKNNPNLLKLLNVLTSSLPITLSLSYSGSDGLERTWAGSSFTTPCSANTLGSATVREEKTLIHFWDDMVLDQKTGSSNY